jgi:hypothetical protein
MKIFNSIKDIKYIKDQNNKEKSLILGSGGFSNVKLVYHQENPTKLYALKKLFKKD